MREELEKREKWQDEAAERGQKGEVAFKTHMEALFQSSEGHSLYEKPYDLKEIYGKGHGIIPDFRIRNNRTGKCIFVEIKRQRAAGNAHERACKYFAPGIIVAARKIANLPEDTFPFWLVFTNGIAKAEKYRREITFWFRGLENHVHLWRDTSDCDELTNHFRQKISPLLN